MNIRKAKSIVRGEIRRHHCMAQIAADPRIAQNCREVENALRKLLKRADKKERRHVKKKLDA